MQKEPEVPQRGGGVRIATQFVRTKEVINKDGKTVSVTVEKPGDKKEVRSMERIRDRLR